MKILISSLQVSNGASKGHLHPAIEIGLALRKRGHTVSLLPLPCPFSTTDKEQLKRCDLAFIDPPSIPNGIIFSPQKLAQLAKNKATTAQAYQSFLISPLHFQFDEVMKKIQVFKPDIVVYDLLVYAVPLAARLLGIPDIGFCAGFKLIAPPHLTRIYQSVSKTLAPLMKEFLSAYSLKANFHHLELLSSSYQLVFIPKHFFANKAAIDLPNVILAGSLPISGKRCEEVNTDFFDPKTKNIVLCFGSVLDPANYPKITNCIIKMAKAFNYNLLVASRKPDFFPTTDFLKIVNYLPLPQLLKTAPLFIHHGGANTFREALQMGVPQILIPLTTDQPIQAELLKHARAGISIYPKEVCDELIYHSFAQLLDHTHPIHERIQTVKSLFSNGEGSNVACEFIEKVANKI